MPGFCFQPVLFSQSLIMADRNRRKSSILKIPKTRAPLQDVNSLDIKSSSDDEITSHTALRRRVSFAGKNFVKEFCAEADIASVFHAPEYEQLLVTSDSSNNTHSDTVSDNNSTIQNRTQSSVYRSICIQDDYDPCEQILKEYKGGSSLQLAPGQSKPAQKTRFSFGEIQIPNFEAEDEPPVASIKEHQAQRPETPEQRDLLFDKKVNPGKVVTDDPIEQNVLPTPKPSSQSVVSGTVCGECPVVDVQPADATQLLDESMDFTRALPCIIQTNSFVPNEGCYSGGSDVMATEINSSHSKTQIMCTSMELTTALATNIYTYPQKNDQINLNYDNEKSNSVSNKTVAMSNTMEFTAALQSNVLNHFPETNVMVNSPALLTNENIMESENFPSHSDSELMCSSMEFTTALPSNIQTHPQENYGTNRETESNDKNCFSSNKTVVMSTTMDFTTAMPSNIMEDPMHHLLKHDISHSSDEALVSTDISSHSRTKVMCTSMELTACLPTNVHIHPQENDKIDGNIGKEYNNFSDKTVAMSTTMEFTKVMPSNIVENLQENNVSYLSSREVLESGNVTSHSRTEIMCSSVELTTGVPSNKHEVGEKNYAGSGNDKENYKCSNMTLAMSTTMEFTKALPSNIQQHFAEENDHSKCYESPSSQKQNIVLSNRTTAILVDSSTQLPFGTNQTDTCQASSDICTSKEVTSASSANIETQSILSQSGIEQNGNSFQDNQVPPKSLASYTAENFEKSQSPILNHTVVEAMDTSEVCLRENVEACKSICEVGDFPLVTKPVTSLSNDESGLGVLHQIPVVEQETIVSTKSMSCLKTSTSHHSDFTSQEVFKPEEQTLKSMAPLSDVTLDLDSIPNPFQSRPRLMSSPKQGGIESVVVQTSQCHAVSTQAAPISPPVIVISNCTPDQNVARDKKINLSQNGEESEDKTKYTSGCAPSAPTVNGDDSNPLKSRPCLKSTLLKEIASNVQTTSNIQVSFVEPCQDSPEKDMDGVVTNKSIVDGPLVDILAADCNLSDVQAPFHDYPSNSTLDISESVRNASVNLPPLQSAEPAEMPSTHIYSKDVEVRMHQNVSQAMEYESNVSVESPTGKPQHHPRENLDLTADSEARITPDIDNSSLSVRSSRSAMESKESCSDKSVRSNPSKRIRDSSQDNIESSPQKLLDRHVSKRKRNSCSESKQTAQLIEPLPMTDLKSPLCESSNRNSYSSEVSCSDASLSSSSVLSVDDVIYSNQKKHPICWEAAKEESTDLWTFKFHCTLMELKIHLKPSPVNGCIESYSGYFHYNVNDSTKPIILWGMKILQKVLSTTEWDSCLRHSSNFMSTLQKIVEVVFPIRKFIIETIIQTGVSNIKIFKDSLFFNVVSFKCHLWFQVHLKLDFWENYTPDHITIKNVVGTTRESEVKNLITGVKKDIYFLRNYIRDVKDYVRTLEEFCR